MNYDAMFLQMMDHLEENPTHENEVALVEGCSAALAAIAAASESSEDMKTRLVAMLNGIAFSAVQTFNDINPQSCTAIDILKQHNPGKFDA